MEKNKIEKHEKGYVVYPNKKNVKEIITIFEQTLVNENFSYVDVMSALCAWSVEVARNGKIKKPQYLSKVSEIWETLDSQQDS